LGAGSIFETHDINARTMRFVVRDLLASRHLRSTMEIPPKWSAADCHARADELEQRAQKATATWAREQCLFSADLWRSLAKDAEAREMAAHKLAAE
jgi:hypothetical protein